MELVLQRKLKIGNALLGSLEVDSVLECFTLENTDVVVVAGRFKVILLYSPSHHRIVPWIIGIPHRSYIELHGGDYAKDSKGCVLIAKGTHQPTTEQEFADLCSTPAVDHLVKLLTGQKDVWITIKDMQLS